MSNVDWYAKKLNQPQPTRRDSTPPTFTPMPQQQRSFEYQAPVHPGSQQFTAPQRFDIDEMWASVDPTSAEGKDERRKLLLHNPKPGPGNKDAQTCPNCGGDRFFSRVVGKRNQQRYPAPMCDDCGYPLVQSGSIGGQGAEAWSQ